MELTGMKKKEVYKGREWENRSVDMDTTWLIVTAITASGHQNDFPEIFFVKMIKLKYYLLTNSTL